MKDFYKTTSIDRYKDLSLKAKEMRNNPTEAEEFLWKYLKAGQLGVKFRRQHPIGDYIADFICLSANMIIEIDGSVHYTDEGIDHDNVRDAQLKAFGFTILRFDNFDVLNNTSKVLTAINKYISNNSTTNTENAEAFSGFLPMGEDGRRG